MSFVVVVVCCMLLYVLVCCCCMLLGGIRSRNGAKGGLAAAARTAGTAAARTAGTAAARTAGTFFHCVVCLCACLTNLIDHFPHSWCSTWNESVPGVACVGCA